MTRVNLWTVLAEWTTALVALALLSFYFFALGSATTADRGESSYMLLSAPYPPHVSLPVASRPVRVSASWCSRISPLRAPLERAPAQHFPDALVPSPGLSMFSCQRTCGSATFSQQSARRTCCTHRGQGRCRSCPGRCMPPHHPPLSKSAPPKDIIVRDDLQNLPPSQNACSCCSSFPGAVTSSGV